MNDRIPFLRDHVQGFMFGAQIDVEPTPLKIASLALGSYTFDAVHRLTGSRNAALLAGFFDGMLQASVGKFAASLGREVPDKAVKGESL